MRTFIDEFKSFAMRGNVVDLAVAVVIGGAFGKIVSSLVDKIVMPLLSFLTGGLDLTYLVWTLRPAVGEKAALVVGYGAFLQSVIDFIIIALAIFVVIKQMNRIMKKGEKEKVKKEEKKTPEDVVLLTEIRDLLKKNK